MTPADAPERPETDPAGTWTGAGRAVCWLYKLKNPDTSTTMWTVP